ncbi:MAG: SMP-30/gluconolactonase/LRE family protein [SAR202 cluster bacterium]|nr:SMP-30/gluconolactonase/LRE family protein [SAR202 cluster bacterium]
MPIKSFSNKLNAILDDQQDIITIGTGFGGSYGPAEGPLWWHENDSLIFSDIHSSKRMSWREGHEPTVVAQNTHQANGLTRDLEGRLLICEQAKKRLVRQESDGSVTVIASNFQGKPFNRTNDVVVTSYGSIYFTDPWNRRNMLTESDMQIAGVYRVSRDLGTLTLLVSDFVHPNGLAFSPDEKLLYVNDSRRGIIRSFEVTGAGILNMASDKVFCDLNGSASGVPDGMKVDSLGNVYCGGSGGLWIIDPAGEPLGIVEHGESATTNVGFGGADWDQLFFTTETTVGFVKLKVKGTQVPIGVAD